ncbi:uncharacterized protein LOC111045274 [Nilaparvata lugens]|uniref:uncharacterized protein LOC111045274 n=1 Tax=Nilaparvata lugens TaxID=108931 RepID=UPI00193DC635|nr:uncharacterized protein LOC111045274 [Nilaparvata lugens]
MPSLLRMSIPTLTFPLGLPSLPFKFESALEAENALVEAEMERMRKQFEKKRKFRCMKCSTNYEFSWDSKKFVFKKFETLRKPEIVKTARPIFSCPYCPYKARMRNNLKRHLVAQHKDHKFKC